MVARTLIVVSLVVAAGCSRPVQTVLASADGLYKRGEYAAAAREYDEVAQREPGRWWAHYRLGACRLELGDPASARYELEIAIVHRPGDPQIVEALAEAMLREGDEEGLYRLLSSEAQRSGTADAYLRWARYCVEIGDPDSARGAFDSAIAIDGGRSVEPYLEAAQFAQRLGDIDEALRLLDRAYQIDPRDRRVQQRMADLGEIPGPTFAAPPGR
jgi:tetratricopeptide (TPR) repeat protein